MDLNQALQEAETAYHKLLTGRSAVEFRDSNGELVQYQPINSAKLAAYIQSLKQQLGLLPGSGPMRVFF